jgi:phenylpyruvate tautomerase PptA (4-oxalocrotonate tautomerase family)
MPYYQFTITPGTRSAELKEEISAAFTQAHCDVTGAPAKWVTCSFYEVPEDHLYTGGKSGPGVRVLGTIRRRPEELKRKLILALAEAWVSVTGEPIENIVIFLNEIPGYQAFEGGELLPDADEEYKLAQAAR